MKVAVAKAMATEGGNNALNSRGLFVCGEFLRMLELLHG